MNDRKTRGKNKNQWASVTSQVEQQRGTAVEELLMTTDRKKKFEWFNGGITQVHNKPVDSVCCKSNVTTNQKTACCWVKAQLSANGRRWMRAVLFPKFGGHVAATGQRSVSSQPGSETTKVKKFFFNLMGPEYEVIYDLWTFTLTNIQESVCQTKPVWQNEFMVTIYLADFLGGEVF